MDVNEALAYLEETQRQELLRQEALHQCPDDDPDDEMDDDLGVEFVDPSLGHLVHFMDLLEALSSPAPEPSPVHRPGR